MLTTRLVGGTMAGARLSSGLEVLAVPTGTNIPALVQRYRASGLVEYAEPDYQVQLDIAPNDPQTAARLWGLNNTGQTGGVADADIDAPEGWDVRRTAPNVVVMVIDSGVRATHQDLAANLWRNLDEIAGNGLDDDGNGYVDDLHGINAILNSGDPADDNGHGTHVAGIIGAVGNNGLGVTGVAWQVKRLATKEAGEPAHVGNAGGASVWWSWTAPESRSATISTAGSTFNTLLGVYTGGAVSTLVQVAANDDSAGGPTSSVTFNAVAGTTYQIAVDGFGGATGRVVLHLPPANDSFARRAALAGVSVSALADTAQATKEAGEPSHAGNAGGRSVWWSWTAPQSGRFTLATTASTFDTLLAVYTGSAVTGLTQVAANDNDPYGGLSSRLSFNAVAGTTYQIAVDGAGGAAGPVALDGGYGHLIGRPGDLGGSYDQCWADGLNDANQVVGNCYDPQGGQLPFSWRAGEPLRQLPLAGRAAGQALEVNSAGQIAGTIFSQGGLALPALWQNGALAELPLLYGGTFGMAFDINDVGEIAGYSGTAAGFDHAALWRGGAIQDLGTLGGRWSRAFAINNRGQVVGQSERANGTFAAFLWQNGSMQELGALPGDDSAAAQDINDNGVIVGQSYAADGARPSKAFLWQNGSMVELPQLPELAGGTTVAFGINNAGLVSGQMGGSVGVLWEGGVPRRLARLLPAGSPWELYSGQDINTHGQVAGGGLLGRGAAFLLSPPLADPAGTNLALNRPASAFSAENASTTASMAVDGNGATRWASGFSDPQWLQVDLGAAYSISRVRLSWEAAYGKAYQVQISNDMTSWTTLYSTTAGDGGVDDLPNLAGSGRYLRVYGTARGTAYGYSLWELEAYGLTASTPTPTRTRTATSGSGLPSQTPTRTRTATSGSGLPSQTPTRTRTATSAPVSCLTGGSTLYLLGGGALCRSAGGGAGSDTLASAAGGSYDGIPTNPQLYTISGLSGSYTAGTTSFALYLDAGAALGNGAQLQVLYDFTGDGTWDRTETFTQCSLDNVAGWQEYTQAVNIRSASGAYANLSGGKVQIKVWNAMGSAVSQLRVGATSANGQQSTVTLPFTLQ